MPDKIVITEKAVMMSRADYDALLLRYTALEKAAEDFADAFTGATIPSAAVEEYHDLRAALVRPGGEK